MRFYQVSLWYTIPRLFTDPIPADPSDRAADFTTHIEAADEASAIDIASRCLLLEQYRRRAWVGQAVPSEPDPLERMRVSPADRDYEMRSMHRQIKIARRQPGFGINPSVAHEGYLLGCEKTLQSLRQGYWV